MQNDSYLQQWKSSNSNKRRTVRSSGKKPLAWKVSNWQAQGLTFPKVGKGIIFLSAVSHHPVDLTARVIALKSKSDLVISQLTNPRWLLNTCRVNTFMRDFRVLPSDPKPSLQPHIMLHPSVHSGWYPALWTSHYSAFVHSPTSVFWATMPPLGFLVYTNLSYSSVASSDIPPGVCSPPGIPVSHNGLLTPHCCFKLFLLLIRILCTNIHSSLLWSFIFENINHVLLILFFPQLYIT